MKMFIKLTFMFIVFMFIFYFLFQNYKFFLMIPALNFYIPTQSGFVFYLFFFEGKNTQIIKQKSLITHQKISISLFIVQQSEES